MKIMVLVKAIPNSAAGALENERDRAAMDAYNDELVAAGIRLDVGGFRPLSDGARVDFRGGEARVIDDRSAAAHEHVVGSWIWRVRSMDEAVAWARRCPFPAGDVCVLELRPFNEQDDH